MTAPSVAHSQFRRTSVASAHTSPSNCSNNQRTLSPSSEQAAPSRSSGKSVTRSPQTRKHSDGPRAAQGSVTKISTLSRKLSLTNEDEFYRFYIADGKVQVSVEKNDPPIPPRSVTPEFYETPLDESPAPTDGRALSTSRFPRRAPRMIFGIYAYPTAAATNEICDRWINPATRCLLERKCTRIHPVDRALYWDKLIQCLRSNELFSTSVVDQRQEPPATSVDQEREENKDVKEVGEFEESCATVGPEDSKSEEARASLAPSADSLPDWESISTWQSVSSSVDGAETSSSDNSGDKSLSPSESSATSVGALSGGEEEASASGPPFRETKICFQWQRFGHCPRGESCKFFHEIPSFESGHVGGAKSSLGASRETPICYSWKKHRTCRFGNNCKYSHGTFSNMGNGSSESNLTITSHARPVPKRNERCHKWLRGACDLGDNCRYLHGDPEFDDKAATLSTSSVGPSSQSASQPSVSSSVNKSVVSAEEYIFTSLLHDHILVRFTAGFDILNLQTAFESSTLLLTNISPRVRSSQLSDLVHSYGRVEEIRLPAILYPKAVVVVRYADSSEAQKAQNAFNGKKMFDTSITARVAANDNVKAVANAVLKDTSVRITWEAPAKETYCGYDTEEQARAAISIARSRPFHGHYLKASIHEGMPAVGVYTVRFRGVPLDVERKDMVHFAEPKDVMWTRPNYQSLDGATNYVRRMLSKDGNRPEYFELMPPPYRDGGVVKAWATFATAAEAKDAARNLDNRRPGCTGMTSIRATHVQSIMYTLSREQFSRHQAAVDTFQASIRGSSATVIIDNRQAHVVVRISADHLKELAQLKVEFEKILKGEVVKLDGKIAWNRFFAERYGIAFLEGLSRKYPYVRIETDIPRRMIRLFGYSAHRAMVAKEILEKVKHFESQKAFIIYPPGHIIGALLVDKEFKKLQAEHGHENVEINFARRIVFIRGDSNLRTTVQAVIDQVASRLKTSNKYDGHVCPVCLDKPVAPVRLKCGHAWCRACLTHYFLAAIEQRSFPLTCLGKDGRCSTKIPVGAAKELLSGNEFNSLVNAAFQAYVQSHQREFHYCPTPDCPQVYRMTSTKTTLQCPSCLASICTKCNGEGHDGLDCVDDAAPDGLFDEWMKAHDVKRCPTCKVPIERSEGCNHMTCAMCQTHICWECMKTFPGGEGIYGHMREEHGTFGLGPID